MPDPVWITLDCTASGNCAQVAHTPGGGVLLRSTRVPEAVVEFTPGEFAQFVAWAKRQPEAVPADGPGDD